jgi:hypothetical protein
MSVASAGDPKGWRAGREPGQNALEVITIGRTYVLPWTQFLYAEGGDDEVRLVFATHDVLARGAGLNALLADVAAQRLVGLSEPPRAERFGGDRDQCIRELSVRSVES